MENEKLIDGYNLRVAVSSISCILGVAITTFITMFTGWRFGFGYTLQQMFFDAVGGLLGWKAGEFPYFVFADACLDRHLLTNDIFKELTPQQQKDLILALQTPTSGQASVQFDKQPLSFCP